MFLFALLTILEQLELLGNKLEWDLTLILYKAINDSDFDLK